MLFRIFVYGAALFTTAMGSSYLATQVTAGNMTVCAIVDKNLRCWGNADDERLPDQWGDEPNEMGAYLPSIDFGQTVQAVKVSSHICVLLNDGTMRCWGKNTDGQCGAGHANNIPVTSAVTVDLGTGRTATDIAVGITHSCAVLDDETLKCWGSNAHGQLGQGNTQPIGAQANQMGDNLTAINLGTGASASQVVCGSGFTCALLSGSNSVKCWGRNHYGQLGLGIGASTWGGALNQMGDASPTVQLGTGRWAKQISANRFHVCAILDNWSAKCWGYNSNGQLGQDHLNNIGDDILGMGDFLPAITLNDDVESISAGKHHTCAILHTGALKCWGDNAGGQLGTHLYSEVTAVWSDISTFPDVSLGTGRQADEVSCSFGDVTCVMLDDQTVKCFGRNAQGQLGQGDTDTRGISSGQMGDALLPVDLISPTTSTTISTSSTKSTSTTASSTTSRTWSSTSATTTTSRTSSSTSASITSTLTTSSTFTHSGTTSTSTSTTISTTISRTSSSTSASITSTQTQGPPTTTSSTFTQSATTSTSTQTEGPPTTTSSTFTHSTTTSTSTSTTISTTISRTSSSTSASITSTQTQGPPTTTSSTFTQSATTSTSTQTQGPPTTTSSTFTHSATTSTSTTTSTTTTSSTSSSTSASITSTQQQGPRRTTSSTFTPFTQIARAITSTTSTTNTQIHGLTRTSTSQSSTDSTSKTPLDSNSPNAAMSSTTTFVTETLTSMTRTSTESGSSASTSPLTLEAFMLLEEQRKAQVAEVLQELDVSENEAVSELLMEIPELSNESADFLWESSKEISTGLLKMVAVSTEAAKSFGLTSVKITGEQGVRISVPLEVLESAGDAMSDRPQRVLMTFTELSSDVLETIRRDDVRVQVPNRTRRLSSTANALQTSGINIKIRSDDGTELEIRNLSEPIVFKLPAFESNGDTTSPTCAFWDEDASRWSMEGVMTLPSTSNEIWCSTTHLSIFGGIIQVLVGNLVQVLACSTAAAVFSAEGLRNLFRNQWPTQGPSLVSFTFLFVFLLSFLLSLLLDKRQHRYFPDKEKELVYWPIKKEEKEEPSVKSQQLEEAEAKIGKKRCCSRNCKKILNSTCGWSLWAIGLLFGYENFAEVVKELLFNAAVSVVDRCIQQIHAHRIGTSRDSLEAVAGITKLLEENKRIDSSEPTRSVQAARQSLTEKEIKKQRDWTVDTFLSSSVFLRLRLLFPALHPYAENTRVSLFTSHVTRTTLIILKLMSAAATGALFFSSSASPPDADPDCEEPEATVGVLSVLFVLFFLQLQQPKAELEWTEEMKDRYRRKWRCRSILFWTLSSLHIAVCALYCLSFLANVTAKDAAEWLESCAMTLLQDLLLLPLLMAFVFAILATIAMCSRKVTRSYWIPDVDEPQDESNLDFVMEEDHWLVATTVITEDLRGENSEDEIFEANLDAGEFEEKVTVKSSSSSDLGTIQEVQV